MAREYRDIRAYSQARWEAFTEADTPWIRVGTALCGLAAGAGNVVEAIRERLARGGVDAHVTEVGCLGLCHAEPLVDVMAPGTTRLVYGHVTPELAEEIVESHVIARKSRPELALGYLDGRIGSVGTDLGDHPMIQGQLRIALRNAGTIDPMDIFQYVANGGYEALNKAVTTMTPAEVLEEVNTSGLRGRGGAAFPTATKWRFLAGSNEPDRYILCNCEEGDPGAFNDKAILESDPHTLVEGMLLAGYATGARYGYIFIRSGHEGPIVRARKALEQAREQGLLGDNILGTEFSFHAEVSLTGDSYVAGEETALMESIEGKRAMPRYRPPFPAAVGVFGKPSNINNVKTLSYVPEIIRHGGQWFADIGQERSKGTAILCLSGNLSFTGMVEVPLGLTLRTGDRGHRRGNTWRQAVEAAADGRPLGRRARGRQSGYPPRLRSDGPSGGDSGVGRYRGGRRGHVRGGPDAGANRFLPVRVVWQVLPLPSGHGASAGGAGTHLRLGGEAGRFGPDADGGAADAGRVAVRTWAAWVQPGIIGAAAFRGRIHGTHGEQAVPRRDCVPRSGPSLRGRGGSVAEPVKLTIDGAEVTCQPGQMVLEAANQAGVYVPYLCYHPGMKPFAACRMCVVEVEGGRGLPASCTLPVQEGMVVRTDTPGVQAVRREIMEMLTAEHPHGCLTCHRIDLCGPQDICLRHVSVNDRCVTCPKNERCELKDTTRYVGVPIESQLDYKYRELPIHTGDPFYDRDYNLCIVCGRCVRACDELRGDNAITFVERAGKALVGTSYGTSLLESGCEFCGACLDVCPVGALVEREHKWEKAANVVRTVCPHCPVGCQLNLEISEKGSFVRAIPELNSPSNQGQACFRGKFGLEYVNRRERLRTPMVRRGGELVEATWDEALSLVASRLGGYVGRSFAMLSAGDSTNEEHYLAQKFTRVVMGSNSVDMACNDTPEIADVMLSSLGVAAATGPIWGLEQADCVVVFAANVTEEHNVVGLPIKKALKAGASVVVIDPREVELTRFASMNLRPIPGTELLLLGGLLKAVVDEGLSQEKWQLLASHCSDPGVLLTSAHAVDLDEVARETGVSTEDIQGAARAFVSAEKAAIVFGLDNVGEELRAGCVRTLGRLGAVHGESGVRKERGCTRCGLGPTRRADGMLGACRICCRGMFPLGTRRAASGYNWFGARLCRRSRACP